MLPRCPLSSLLLLLVGCGDQQVTKVVQPPTAAIETPTDGSSLDEGVPIAIRGRVTDEVYDDALDQIAAVWAVNGERICEAAVINTTGISDCEYTFTAGDAVLTFTATNPDGQADTATSNLSINVNKAPSATISSPETGGEYDAHSPTLFEGSVSDGEDAADLLSVVWTSDVDGDLPLSASPTSDGTVSGTAYLSAGNHTITLTVTDSTGRTGQDNVQIQVEVGQEPTLELVTPTSGDTVAQGEAVSFHAVVADDRTSAADLAFEWESSLDGVFSTQGASSAGDAEFVYSGLSAGTHTITVRATDEDGMSAVDSATLIVDLGEPPEVSLETPGSGEAYNEGDDIYFSALVSDDRSDPTDLTLYWESDVDGIFSTEGANSAGEAEFYYDGLSPGSHTITLTAIDEDGFSSVDSSTILINGLPSAPGVSISPDPAGSGDDLAVTIDVASVDPDGDPVSYSYAWYLDGVLSAYTSNPLPDAATSRGDVWTVEVTPNDGTGDGPAGSDSITVGNGAPTLSSVSIDPAVAYTDDTLTAVPTGFSDPDGDAEGYRYQWYLDGLAISGATDATLPGTAFVRGDDITVEVWPWDGSELGTSVSSGVRTISNTPPTGPAIAVSPERPEPGEDLSCNVVTDSTDADGDSVSYTYSWTKDGSATGITSSTVSGSYTSDGETWTCYVVASDGTDSATAVTDSVDVGDYTAPDAPVLTSLDPYRNETSAVVYGTSEALVTITLYEVSDSGTSTATTTASGAGSFTFTRTLSAGETYSWYATATDAEGNVSGVSNTVGTEVCDPADDFEDSTGYGDSCGDAVVDWSTLADNGTSTIEIQGNILDSSDEDWYSISTSDNATTGINYYRFHVELSSGASDYAFVVYQGGCTSSYLECGSGSSTDPEGSGYTEFEDYAEDQGDGGHSIPSDTRACYDGDAGYNNCESLADTYVIHVFRITSGYDCDGYTLQVTNGSW